MDSRSFWNATRSRSSSALSRFPDELAAITAASASSELLPTASLGETDCPGPYRYRVPGPVQVTWLTKPWMIVLAGCGTGGDGASPPPGVSSYQAQRSEAILSCQRCGSLSVLA